ncbi:Detected protein of confused Function [Hibiscus syriacus]|uniref:Glutaredoxin-like protein n=1 Tax=Hibiscus syriacus TaxID=106335 RepID=A0A6A3AG15_HIBSY|nr:Detected protein of confused Function [Hibiscus syriacus]
MLSKGIETMAARSLSMVYVPAHKPKWVFSPLSFCSSASKPRKLVLYSKPGCCLCDGLKEKLHAALSLSVPDSLHDVELQVRDITSNPEWEKAYQYEIPVLAKVLSDGTEIKNSTWIISHNDFGKVLTLKAKQKRKNSGTREVVQYPFVFFIMNLVLSLVRDFCIRYVN